MLLLPQKTQMVGLSLVGLYSANIPQFADSKGVGDASTDIQNMEVLEQRPLHVQHPACEQQPLPTTRCLLYELCGGGGGGGN